MTMIDACRKIIKDNHLDIKSRVLCMQFRRYLHSGKKRDKRCIFDEETELLFVSILEGMSLLNRCLDRCTFIEHVATFAKRGDEWNASNWYSGFLSRHRDKISAKALQALSQARFDTTHIDVFQDFADSYLNLIDQKHIQNDLIFNCDETRISLNGRYKKLKGIESQSKPLNSFIEPTNYPCARYIPFINSNKVFMQVFVLPTECDVKIRLPLIKTKYYHRRGKPHTYYCFTNTGYVNTECWLKILTKFCDNLKLEQNLRNKMLLMDNLAIHVNPKAISLLMENHIYPLYFPTKSTHVLQPCDDLVFQALKSKMTKEYRKKVIGQSKYEPVCLNLLRNYENFTNVITPEVIQQSWDDCGLIPPNCEKIIERGKLLNGAPKLKTIYDEITAMFMNIIKDALDGDDSEVFPIPKDVNDPILPEDFVEKIKQERDKLIPHKEQMPPRVSKSKRSRKKNEEKDDNNKSANFQCFCHLHSILNSAPINKETEWVTCNICNLFRVCEDCDKRTPELMREHEFVCYPLLVVNKLAPEKKRPRRATS